MRAGPRFPSFGSFARTPQRFVLSVLSKRTFTWSERGDVVAIDEQPPLHRDIDHARRDDRNCEMQVQGRDTWPLKRATDVVVTGHARVPLGLPVRELNVELSLGEHVRRIRVFGQRHIDYRGHGTLFFSEPEPFMSVELSWWNAYGGVDPTVLPEGLDDTPLFLGKPLLELFPGTYPRNPCGTGYMIQETPRFLDGLLLPQLEDPAHLLRREHLLVRDPKLWWRRPAPACFGWYHPLWHPRILHTGGKPYHLAPPPEAAAPPSPPPEPSEDDEEDKDLGEPGQPKPSLDFANEAAPELILPFLKGDETLSLSGFGTKDKQQFRLPPGRPEVQARADGVELTELECRIHTLAIDADKRQFYLLFSNRFDLPHDFAADLSAGLTRADVVSRCHVRVDGYPLGPEDWPAVGVEEEEGD